MSRDCPDCGPSHEGCIAEGACELGMGRDPQGCRAIGRCAGLAFTGCAVAEQPAPHGISIDISEIVIKDMQDRRELGRKRYGESLRPFNGRDALVDAYQEALDLCVYLRQAIYEQAHPELKGAGNEN